MTADIRPLKRAVRLLPRDDGFRILVEDLEDDIPSPLFTEVERRWRAREAAVHAA